MVFPVDNPATALLLLFLSVHRGFRPTVEMRIIMEWGLEGWGEYETSFFTYISELQIKLWIHSNVNYHGQIQQDKA